MGKRESQDVGTNEEVEEGGIYGAPVEGADAPSASAPSSPEELEEQASQRIEEAQEAMRGEPGEQPVAGVGVQEEETARAADSLVFPGAGVRELKETTGTDDVEEAVEKLKVETGRDSPTENTDRFPPSEWPPKEGSSR